MDLKHSTSVQLVPIVILDIYERLFKKSAASTTAEGFPALSPPRIEDHNVSLSFPRRSFNIVATSGKGSLQEKSAKHLGPA
jgi:hypothetical protein